MLGNLHHSIKQWSHSTKAVKARWHDCTLAGGFHLKSAVNGKLVHQRMRTEVTESSMPVSYDIIAKYDQQFAMHCAFILIFLSNISIK